MPLNVAPLARELRNRVLARTGHRLRNLNIELSSERVILHGQAATYYVKQLAQHEVLESLPGRRLENDIEVKPDLASHVG